MPATVQLTLEQIAKAIKRLTPEELESLEMLLDPRMTAELLKRSQEMHMGKTVSLKDSKLTRKTS